MSSIAHTTLCISYTPAFEHAGLGLENVFGHTTLNNAITLGSPPADDGVLRIEEANSDTFGVNGRPCHAISI